MLTHLTRAAAVVLEMPLEHHHTTNLPCQL
jgi:hypothetical protein